MKKFYTYVNAQFTGHPLEKAMSATCENSGFHLEPTTWCHTSMCLKEFEDIQDELKFNDTAATIARLALLFHDTGKPAARTQKENAERGIYHSYPGHEQMSARELENYAVDNWQLLQTELGLTDWYQIYCAMYLIEIHLPYDMKNAEKRSKMAMAVHDIETKLDAKGLFAAILRSDARGRISTDKKLKLANSYAWIYEFYALKEFSK